MNDFNSHRRSSLARLGLTALNLLSPGLGLLRTGRVRLAVKLFIAQLLFAVATLVCFAIAPTWTFAMFVVFATAAISTTMAVYGVALVATWRSSRIRCAVPWWGRWYGLVIAGLIAAATGQIAIGVSKRYYHSFYVPSAAMQPTMLIDDRFLADMRGGRPPLRGDIVLIDHHGTLYVKRVAAIGGDRIAMRDGVPIIDGLSASQSIAGRVASVVEGPLGASLLRERLPGEIGSHLILDVGPTVQDNVAPDSRCRADGPGQRCRTSRPPGIHFSAWRQPR